VLWRHNVAGDLPGNGDKINATMLAELVTANRGKRGFTYTHKHLSAENLTAIRAANRSDFTILSANTLEEADALARKKAGPVVLILRPMPRITMSSRPPKAERSSSAPRAIDKTFSASTAGCARIRSARQSSGSRPTGLHSGEPSA
jgi:hypothetical protein